MTQSMMLLSEFTSFNLVLSRVYIFDFVTLHLWKENTPEIFCFIDINRNKNDQSNDKYVLVTVNAFSGNICIFCFPFT